MHIEIQIEDWDGEPALRLPSEVLQRVGVGIGDTLYLVEACVGDGRRLVLSKTSKIPDRVDALVAQWDREFTEELAEATRLEPPRDE